MDCDCARLCALLGTRGKSNRFRIFDGIFPNDATGLSVADCERFFMVSRQQGRLLGAPSPREGGGLITCQAPVDGGYPVIAA